MLDACSDVAILDLASQEGSVHFSKVRIAAMQAPAFHKDLSRALAFLNDAIEQAKEQQVHLLAFPEGFMQGYIVQEQQAREVAIDLSSQRFFALLDAFPSTGPMLVVGIIEVADDKLSNTAIVVKDQALVGRYRKRHLLPSEAAFTAGRALPIFKVQSLRFCINICYDTNFPMPADQISQRNTDLIVCCANNMLKQDTARKYSSLHNSVRGQRCQETKLWLMSSDVTGHRDGHLALGPTAVLSPNGDVARQLPLGKVGMLVSDLPEAMSPIHRKV